MFNYNGYEININNGGRFVTRIGDMELYAESLAGLKEQIDKEVKAAKTFRKLDLPVIGMHDNALYIGKLTGIHRNTGDLQTDPKLPKGTGRYDSQPYLKSVLVDTPENRALITDINITQQHLDKLLREYRMLEFVRRGFVRQGYGRVDAREYEARLTAIEK